MLLPEGLSSFSFVRNRAYYLKLGSKAASHVKHPQPPLCLPRPASPLPRIPLCPPAILGPPSSQAPKALLTLSHTHQSELSLSHTQVYFPERSLFFTKWTSLCGRRFLTRSWKQIPPTPSGTFLQGSSRARPSWAPSPFSSPKDPPASGGWAPPLQASPHPGPMPSYSHCWMPSGRPQFPALTPCPPLPGMGSPSPRPAPATLLYHMPRPGAEADPGAELLLFPGELDTRLEGIGKALIDFPLLRATFHFLLKHGPPQALCYDREGGLEQRERVGSGCACLVSINYLESSKKPRRGTRPTPHQPASTFP